MDWTIKGDGNWKQGAVMELRVGAFLLTAEHYGGVVACELRDMDEFPDEESPPMVAFQVDAEDDAEKAKYAALQTAHGQLGEVAERISVARESIENARLALLQARLPTGWHLNAEDEAIRDDGAVVHIDMNSTVTEWAVAWRDCGCAIPLTTIKQHASIEEACAICDRLSPDLTEAAKERQARIGNPCAVVRFDGRNLFVAHRDGLVLSIHDALTDEVYEVPADLIEDFEHEVYEDASVRIRLGVGTSQSLEQEVQEMLRMRDGETESDRDRRILRLQVDEDPRRRNCPSCRMGGPPHYGTSGCTSGCALPGDAPGKEGRAHCTCDGCF